MTNPLEKMVLRSDPSMRLPFAAQFGIVRHNDINKHPNLPLHRVHQGWDLEARIGTPVRAVAAGKIVKCASVGLGSTVCIQTQIKVSNGNSQSFDLHVVYGHLSQVKVAIGNPVKEGDPIGCTGNSGAESEPPHLHFELRKSPEQPKGLADRIDPANFFAGQMIVKTKDGLYMPYRPAAPTHPFETIKTGTR